MRRFWILYIAICLFQIGCIVALLIMVPRLSLSHPLAVMDRMEQGRKSNVIRIQGGIIYLPAEKESINTVRTEWQAMKSQADQAMRVGDFVLGELRYKKALVTALPVEGKESSAVAQLLQDLGDCSMRQNNKGEAARYYKRCLDIQQKRLGPEHQFLDPVINNLASIAQEAGDLAEARNLYSRLLQIRTRVLPSTNSDYKEAVMNLKSLKKGARAEKRLTRIGKP